MAPKDIPYRSEAIADFMQANMLDEIHTFFMDNEMYYQQHFSQERTILQE